MKAILLAVDWFVYYICIIQLVCLSYFVASNEICDNILNGKTYKQGEFLEITMTPPILLGMQGSGTLYFRELIEAATGLYSGSVGLQNGQTDIALSKVFRYEGSCGQRMSVNWCALPNDMHINQYGTLGFSRKGQRQRCRRGVMPFANSAIVVTRNPYDAIIAAYTSYLKGPEIIDFNSNIWQDYAIQQAKYYKQVTSELWPKLLSALNSKSIVIRYEEFDDSDRSVKTQIIEKMAIFAARIPTNITSCLYSGVTGESVSHCASALSRAKAACALQNVTLQRMDVLQQDRFSGSPYYSTVNISFAAAIRGLVSDYASLFNYSRVPPKYSTDKIVAAMSPSLSTTSDQRSNANDILFKNDNSSNNNDSALTSSRSLASCILRYGSRTFYSSITGLPTLLLSYPGSGNTWTRYLIEFGTGVFTGSTDVADKSLQMEFIGEKFCEVTQPVIKAHPDHISFVIANASCGQSVPKIELIAPEHVDKCKNGNIHRFDRVVFLVRHPLHSIVAEFQRYHTHSHYKSINADNFPWEIWEKEAVLFAASYSSYWKRILKPMLTTLLPMGKALVVHYEDLLSSTISTSTISSHSKANTDTIDGDTRIIGKYKALSDIVRFISSSVYSSDECSVFVNNNKQAPNIPDWERLECAFLLSSSPKVHRTKSSFSVNSSFVYAHNPRVVEEMWDYLKDYAMYFGYSKQY